MRIALVSKRYPPHTGGVEEHVSALATEYARQGDDVVVLTYGTGPRPAQDVVDGVEVRRFPLSCTVPNFEYSRALAEHLGMVHGGFDVVHAHSYHALPALSAARVRPASFVFTPHYHGTGHSALRSALHRPYRLVGRQIVGRAGRVVCVSAAEQALLLRHFPEAAGRCVVVPNGIRRPDPAPDLTRHHWAAEIRRSDLVTVGRLESYKGVDHAITALAGLPGRTRLHVLGEGPHRAALAVRAARSGLSKRVFFHGRLPRPALDAALQRCGAVLSLSRHEAFGLVLGEALAAGAKVVASDIPAHRELAAPVPERVALWAYGEKGLAAVIAELLDRPAPGTAVALPGWADIARQTRGLYAEAGTGGAATALR
ncbi:glycosyltransferase family 4 protein [Symbioplanes lichenis]|uniref:glycosyltransferase family 4 protein n=1 Tax=Symbioplanes lichenis TaxID=1629072 RepID=UPI002739801E|nr:glycosyltransferase family 4 protein [Actinoplanes lichenis]